MELAEYMLGVVARIGGFEAAEEGVARLRRPGRRECLQQRLRGSSRRRAVNSIRLRHEICFDQLRAALEHLVDVGCDFVR